jgi:hypothetical protein
MGSGMEPAPIPRVPPDVSNEAGAVGPPLTPRRQVLDRGRSFARKPPSPTPPCFPPRPVERRRLGRFGFANIWRSSQRAARGSPEATWSMDLVGLVSRATTDIASKQTTL